MNFESRCERERERERQMEREHRCHPLDLELECPDVRHLLTTLHCPCFRVRAGLTA